MRQIEVFKSGDPRDGLVHEHLQDPNNSFWVSNSLDAFDNLAIPESVVPFRHCFFHWFQLRFKDACFSAPIALNRSNKVG